jgi:predicted dehydrogenase
MHTDWSRRDFLHSLGITTAGLMAAGYTATARGYAANESIHVACLGTGGRMLGKLMPSLRGIAGVRLVAACDVWERRLAESAKQLDPQAALVRDYRELLDRPEIDAVIIASPDHWHVPMAVDACAAGKHVYVEKPLTHDLAEGQRIIDAQNRYQCIVQVGMQQRSMPHVQHGREIVQSGALGRIHKVKLTWNRNAARHRVNTAEVDPAAVDWGRFLGAARQQPFHAYRFRNWRWFWDFGGGILTDLMVHWLDVANFYLGLEHPQTAATIGDNFQTADLWETPDTVQTLLHYPGQQVQVHFEGTFVNARSASMIEFMGTEGSLYVDRGRYELHPERRSTLEPIQWVLGSGPRGADFYDQPDGETLHLANWLQCIRSGDRPNAPAEAGVTAVLGAHLANIAYRKNQVARWSEHAG